MIYEYSNKPLKGYVMCNFVHFVRNIMGSKVMCDTRPFLTFYLNLYINIKKSLFVPFNEILLVLS